MMQASSEQLSELARQLGEAYQQGKTVQQVADELRARFGLMPVKLVAAALDPNQVADIACRNEACHPLGQPAGRAWLTELKGAL